MPKHPWERFLTLAAAEDVADSRNARRILSHTLLASRDGAGLGGALDGKKSCVEDVLLAEEEGEEKAGGEAEKEEEEGEACKLFAEVRRPFFITLKPGVE